MSDLQVERTDGVVLITLNRPERKNAITSSLVDKLIAALQEVGRTPADRALVLTGAGGSFCSGIDLATPLGSDALSFMRRVGELCSLLHGLPRPTLAKVSGSAIGFGCNLALCCDLVVAADDATFGEIFTKLGLSLDGGGAWTLPRLVGLARAKELAFFGQSLSGTEAEHIGLVNRAVPREQLDAVASDWAQRLADGPTLAMSIAKTALNNSYESSFAAAIENEVLGQTVAVRSWEAKEGAQAYAERRKPDFRKR